MNHQSRGRNRRFGRVAAEFPRRSVSSRRTLQGASEDLATATLAVNLDAGIERVARPESSRDLVNVRFRTIRMISLRYRDRSTLFALPALEWDGLSVGGHVGSSNG